MCFYCPVHVLGMASKLTETWHETLSSCTPVFSALYAQPTKLLSQLPFSSLISFVLSMRPWNPLNVPAFLASLTWAHCPSLADRQGGSMQKPLQI